MLKSKHRKAQFAPEVKRLMQKAEAKVEHKIWDRDPLKQYIRRFGWLTVIKDYYQHRSLEGVADPLKILTLPGENATDIGLFWLEGIIVRDSNGILNVAICDDSSAETVVSNLAKLGSLLAYSDKRLDEALQEETIINQFPFDVINMDLTTPLIPAKAHFNEEAIERVFRLQRGQSFLLFLTTKPDTNQITISNLLNVLNHNLQNEPRFLEAYRNRYGGTSPDLCKRNLAEFVQVVYPKILARYARYFGYKTREHFIAHYSGGRGNTMVCHSFEFEPLARKETKLKYEPRIPRVLENEISDRVYGEFSTAHQRIAIDAYVEFIEYLPTHQSISVDRILQGDEGLNSHLQDDAVQLIRWWDNVGN